MPQGTIPAVGAVATSDLATSIADERTSGSLNSTHAPFQPIASHPDADAPEKQRTFADSFAGTRQDSGDPQEFIKTMRDFYDKQGIKEKKTIVFSDSLNVDRCLEYKKATEEAGFQPSFGVGTFFTSMCIPWWRFAHQCAGFVKLRRD